MKIRKFLQKIPLKFKIIPVAIIIALVFFVWPKLAKSQSVKENYITEKVTRGTIVSSISATGDVSSANSTVINTQASGVVKKVYVKDGDTVKTGDRIAEIELDLEGRQRSSQAYASYQSAKNSFDSANANLLSLQSDMFTKWKEYMDLAQSSSYENPDKSPREDQRNLPQFWSPKDDWLYSEQKFKDQQNVIAQARTSLNSAWLTYQMSSPVVYAPISGTVTGFSLQEGSVITAQTNSSGGASSQKIANIRTSALPAVLVNLTEIDVPQVKIGDRAILTFDAFKDKTYTGSVISIDTVGTVSSGVTSYPTVIKLDTEIEGMLPNMSAQVNIITGSKDDILLVPSSAIQIQNGIAVVRVLKTGNPETVEVETGISSSFHTEIVSGLSENDEVITNYTSLNSNSRAGQQGQSPFSSFGIRTGAGSMIRR